jgi:hypothetical protein
MLISAAASLRCTSAVLELVVPHVPFLEQAPCANSGRSWLLRMGLFRLTCQQEQADDWVWMMDHTLQLGPYKCLIVLGIRLSAWESERPLTHEDMSLLNLTPMEHSSGEQVQEQLQAAVLKTGIPRAIVSDEGTDLKRALELFQQQHPEVRHQHDMKHKNALLLKQQLAGDPRWAQFTTQANRTKLATTQTALAFLNPPGLKSKARYMNLDTLVSWGVRTLAYLDDPGRSTDPSVDQQKLQEKLAWLRSYRSDLERWSELMAVVRAAEKIVQSGIRPSIGEELRPQLEAVATTPAARELSQSILAFLQEESVGLAVGEKLIGSTEVLESVIGKYKRLQSTHSKGGMTAMLLSIGAMIGRQTTSVLKQGLEAVRFADVEAWCQTHLGLTLHTQRRRLSATKTG